jgi:predicted O-methyltransferase YrrM
MDPDEIVRRYITQEDVGAFQFSKDTLILRLSQLVDFSATQLDEVAEAASRRVQEHAQALYGARWHFYSAALRREVLRAFQLSIAASREGTQTVGFLEIGSCQGVSMGAIGSMLKDYGALGKLTSIDPYFESGYREGRTGPWGEDFHIEVDKRSRDLALQLYRNLGLKVELLEKISRDGLAELIRRERKYNLIYIDGSHEGLNPIADFGLCQALVAPQGIIMLDDPYWPDVAPLRELCQRHLEVVAECWKVVAFRAKTGGS